MEVAPPGRLAPNLVAMLGPQLKDPFPENCQQFSILLHKLFESRAQLTEKIYEFIFGPESEFEKMTNDTGAAVRWSLSEVGVGSLADALFGEAPKRPLPHAKLVLHRSSTAAVSAEVIQMETSPGGEAEPEQVPGGFGMRPDNCLSPFYGDLRMDLLHLSFDGADGLPFSDMRGTASLNAHDKMTEFCLHDMLRACMEMLRWIASDGGDGDAFKTAYLETFPNSTRFSRRFVDVENAKVICEKVDESTWKIGMEAPVDYSEAARNYPRLNDLLSLINPLLVQFQCQGTDSVWLECKLEDGVLSGEILLRDGSLIGRRCGTPIKWDESGRFSTDAVVEFSLVPLGLSLGAIPFPRTLLRCEIDRSGTFSLVCLEAQESGLESVASVAFDVATFRRFLTDDFRFRIAHVLSKDAWVVHCFTRLSFPSGSVVFAVKQWFKDFVHTQLQEMDVVKAAADFFSAMSSDAAAISAAWRRAAAETTTTGL